MTPACEPVNERAIGIARPEAHGDVGFHRAIGYGAIRMDARVHAAYDVEVGQTATRPGRALAHQQAAGRSGSGMDDGEFAPGRQVQEEGQLGRRLGLGRRLRPPAWGIARLSPQP